MQRLKRAIRKTESEDVTDSFVAAKAKDVVELLLNDKDLLRQHTDLRSDQSEEEEERSFKQSYNITSESSMVVQNRPAHREHVVDCYSSQLPSSEAQEVDPATIAQITRAVENA